MTLSVRGEGGVIIIWSKKAREGTFPIKAGKRNEVRAKQILNRGKHENEKSRQYKPPGSRGGTEFNPREGDGEKGLKRT